MTFYRVMYQGVRKATGPVVYRWGGGPRRRYRLPRPQGVFA